MEFLSSLSDVDTTVGLISTIVIGVLGYLGYTQKQKMKQIANVIDKADTGAKANLASDLAGILPSSKIAKLSKENSYELIKLKLKEESNRFKSNSNLLSKSVLFLFILLLGLIIKEYFIDFQKTKGQQQNVTHGENSPNVNGDNNTINFNEDTNNKDSIK